ncbi:hypothetical protein SMICM304S_05023 [Streptomyces microflavus]
MLQNSGLKGFGDLWRVVNGCGGVLVICAVWSEEVKVFSFFWAKPYLWRWIFSIAAAISSVKSSRSDGFSIP